MNWYRMINAIPIQVSIQVKYSLVFHLFSLIFCKIALCNSHTCFEWLYNTEQNIHLIKSSADINDLMINESHDINQSNDQYYQIDH